MDAAITALPHRHSPKKWCVAASGARAIMGGMNQTLLPLTWWERAELAVKVGLGLGGVGGFLSGVVVFIKFVGPMLH